MYALADSVPTQRGQLLYLRVLAEIHILFLNESLEAVMANYIEYELDDGATILVEAVDSTEEGIIQASRRGDTITKATKNFRQAINEVKQSAKIFVDEMAALEVSEMSVAFGIKATGELSNFAVGKAGLESNYQVVLKWKKPERE